MIILTKSSCFFQQDGAFAGMTESVVSLSSQRWSSVESEIDGQKEPVKLLIDTGSSTLAFHASNYSPSNDKCLELTQYAQCVTYCKGGWAGPVLKSKIIYVNQKKKIEREGRHGKRRPGFGW